MKALILALALTAPAAHASMKVKCNGQYKNNKGVAIEVNLATSEDEKTLELTRVVSGHKAEPWDTESLKITKANPMWPVATLEAEVDDRPRDGVLTKASLSISNESVSREYQGDLKITTKGWNRMSGQEFTYEQNVTVSCVMN